MRPLGKTELKRFYEDFWHSHTPACEVMFLLQGLENGANVGSMFRLSEACGAKILILTGKTPRPPHGDISITSKGQEIRVDWQYFAKVEDGLTYAKSLGYELVALEITKASVLYTLYKYSKKVCFILGNEEDGVYDDVLSRCDGIVFVPMLGKNLSLNVHVTAAIVSYDALMRDV